MIVTFVKYRLILNVEKEIIVGSMFKPRSGIYNHIAISGNNHNYNKIVKSDWLSTALISALIGQFNRTVRVMPK